MPAITPNLWFDTQAEEAAKYYVSIFPNSSIENVTLYGEAGPGEPGTPVTVDFTLDGMRFTPPSTAVRNSASTRRSPS